jgi:hypothetical protein
MRLILRLTFAALAKARPKPKIESYLQRLNVSTAKNKVVQMRLSIDR